MGGPCCVWDPIRSRSTRLSPLYGVRKGCYTGKRSIKSRGRGEDRVQKARDIFITCFLCCKDRLPMLLDSLEYSFVIANCDL
eukprot:9469249-Pyramimonas_sp.AAC.1